MEVVNKIITFFTTNWELITMIASGVVGLISLVVAIINKVITAIKTKDYKQLSGILELNEQIVPDLVKYIESVYPHGNGELKKEYVKRGIVDYCAVHSIDIDEGKINDLINGCIALLNLKR